MKLKSNLLHYILVIFFIQSYIFSSSFPQQNEQQPFNEDNDISLENLQDLEQYQDAVDSNFNIFSEQYKEQIKFFNETNTYILNEQNFNNITLSGFGSKKWFLVFYAPWCKHCKMLLPTIHSVSRNLTQHKELGIKVGVINCEENPNLQDRFLVNGFPTMIYLANGNLFEYEGERTEDAIKNFVIDDWATQRGSKIPMEVGYFRSKFKNFGKIFIIGCVIVIAILGGWMIYECMGKTENYDAQIEEDEQEQEELLKKQQ